MRRTFMVALLAMTGVTGLMAQRGPGERGETPATPEQMIERRVARLTTLLGLDATQQGQAKTIFTEELTASQGLREKIQAAHEALQTAVQGSASDSQIEGLTAPIGTLHAQSLAVHAKAQAKFRGILNSTQKEKLDTLRGNQGGGVPRGLRGGPMGPGAMRMRGGF